MGQLEKGEAGWCEGRGFVELIFKNLQGDKDLVREQLREEHVPQMLRAAVEALVECRARARGMSEPDAWALNRLRWVAGWINGQGLEVPSKEDVRAAAMEYSAMAAAA